MLLLCLPLYHNMTVELFHYLSTRLCIWIYLTTGLSIYLSQCLCLYNHTKSQETEHKEAKVRIASLVARINTRPLEGKSLSSSVSLEARRSLPLHWRKSLRELMLPVPREGDGRKAPQYMVTPSQHHPLTYNTVMHLSLSLYATCCSFLAIFLSEGVVGGEGAFFLTCPVSI